MNIIDSHSHIGLGYQDIATIEEYKRIRQQVGITYSLLMPQPTIIRENGNEKETYDTINQYLYELIENNLKEEASFIPLISPVYMTEKDVIQYIEWFQPLALKIHYRTDYSYPEMISKEMIKVLKKYNIPLIVHTDFSKKPSTEKEKYKSLNSALKWFQFFQKNELKGYLTHGARLNREVLESINKGKNIVIGIGPDLFLQESNQLEEDQDYLKTLRDYVDPSLLLYDMDYNWNRTQDNQLDILSIDRIKRTWREEDVKKILEENSKRFFQIKEGGKIYEKMQKVYKYNQ